MTRYVIAAGTSDYGTDTLPFAIHDADRVVRLFTQRFGYTQALPDLAHNPTTDALRRGFARWLRDRTADDVVVFYYAGHGDKSADGRHYLLCADSEFDALTSTALATEDLLRLWSDAGQPVDNLLIILDVCYAGAGAIQLELVKDLASVRRRQEADGIWVLAAARARDEAEENLFVDTLERAIDTAKAGQRARYLAIDDVVDTINGDLLERGRSQRAACVPRSTRIVPPFIPNPKYWPDAPPEGVDLATQRKLRRLDLEQHFEPRSRGVERGTDLGSLFCGRTRVLGELTAWLNSGDGRARVVTGGPGTGKSAVLGRLVMRHQPFAIHARQLRLDQVVSAFAGELGVEADTHAVLRALQERDRTVVVVDALDEATDPAAIARELLQPMTTIPTVRLLVGTRPEYVPRLRPAITEINLDLPEYTGPDDVAEYVTKILLAEEDPHQPTPYRDNPTLAMAVAAGVARGARNNFLVARMNALSLVYAPEPVDTNTSGWQKHLGADIGAVLEEYLSRFGENADRVRRLLTPLAYAVGRGLPWDDLWAPLATVLSGVTCTDEDIAWLLRNANSYVVEATENDRSVYRLYHQALVEHLQHRLPSKEAHRRIVNTLRPDDPFETHPYVRDHLFEHAAKADMVDQLITDPDLVLAANSGALYATMHAVTTAEGASIAAAIEQAMTFWPDPSYLQLAARRYGANTFADRIRTVTWSPLWADVVPRTPHRVLGSRKAAALATSTLAGHGPVAIIAFEDGLVAVVDVDTGIIVSSVTSTAKVGCVAPVLLPDRQLIVLLVAGGRFYRWEVAAMTVIDVHPPTVAVSARAVAADGSRTGLLVHRDGSVQVYDVSSGQFTSHIPSPHDNVSINKVVAATNEENVNLIVTQSFQDDILALDVTTGRWRTLPTSDEADPFFTVLAVSPLPYLVVTSRHGQYEVHNYLTGQFIGYFGLGTPLAVGTLADGQVVMLIESGMHELGLWAADDVIASCAQIRHDTMIDAITAALDDPARRADRPPITIGELLELALTAPGRLGLTGPVAVVAATNRWENERVFVTCLSNGEVQIWPAADTPSGRTMTPLVSYATRSSAVWSGYHMTYWTLWPARCLQRLVGHGSGISHAAFARRPDGRDVLITTDSGGTIRSWDVHLEEDAVGTPSRHARSVIAVDIWGKWIVYANRDGEIQARALADGHPANTPALYVNEGVKRLDAARGVVIDEARNAYLWEWGQQPLVPVLSDVVDLDTAVTPDRTHLLVSLHHSGELVVNRRVGEQLVLVGQVDTGIFNYGGVRAAAVPSGETVAAVLDGLGILRVWTIGSMNPRGTVEVDRFPGRLSTGQLPDGRVVAIVPGSPPCVLVDLEKVERVGTLPDSDKLEYCQMAALTDGRHVVVGVDNSAFSTLKVWNLYDMSLVTRIHVGARARDLALSPDGIVVLATDSGLITIRL